MAGRLARALDVRHVELDALHWGPGWTPAATDAFRERTLAAIAGDGWVVDGNYGQVRELVWERSDTVVRLDY